MPSFLLDGWRGSPLVCSSSGFLRPFSFPSLGPREFGGFTIGARIRLAEGPEKVLQCFQGNVPGEWPV